MAGRASCTPVTRKRWLGSVLASVPRRLPRPPAGNEPRNVPGILPIGLTEPLPEARLLDQGDVDAFDPKDLVARPRERVAKGIGNDADPGAARGEGIGRGTRNHLQHSTRPAHGIGHAEALERLPDAIDDRSGQ